MRVGVVSVSQSIQCSVVIVDRMEGESSEAERESNAIMQERVTRLPVTATWWRASLNGCMCI